MEPVRFKTQTKLHDTEKGIEGNCTQAAIASLMGMELDEVPDFNTLHKDKPHSGYFWDHIHKWFYERGFQFQMSDPKYSWPCLYLASGPSPRGLSHIVVMEDGKMVHDPHPSRAGIEKIDRNYIIMPIDPSLMRLVEGVKFVPDDEEYH